MVYSRVFLLDSIRGLVFREAGKNGEERLLMLLWCIISLGKALGRGGWWGGRVEDREKPLS